MDEHKHNILVIFVLFYGHISSRRNRNPLYLYHLETRHKMSTRGEKNEEI
jgi:hypothetical protein